MKIFAFAGPPGSGKSTFCRLLHEAHGYRILNFADPLKAAAKALWGLSEEQVNGDLKEAPDPRWGVTPRTIMQHLGTEHARHLCPYIHVRHLIAQIDGSHYPGYCVGDVRFENEFKALRDIGACLIYLTPWDKAASEHGGIPGHPSEAQLFPGKFDHVVHPRRPQAREEEWIRRGEIWRP